MTSCRISGAVLGRCSGGGRCDILPNWRHKPALQEGGKLKFDVWCDDFALSVQATTKLHKESVVCLFTSYVATSSDIK